METRLKKRFRSKQEWRQIVEETLKPGASVSLVARAHDVNANQVFHWRRQYHAGRFEETEGQSTALVPVKISRSLSQSPAAKRRRAKAWAPKGAGSIDIDLGHARVRIEGAVDPDCVRAALQGLIR